MNATENECRCGRPTRDQAFVCDPCADNLAKALGDVTWLAEELETTITRQRGVDYRTATGGSGPKKPTERPSPVQWGAADARASLRGILVSWARLCADEDVRNSSPYPGLPDDNLVSIARWLMWRVDGLALHEAGPDAVDEIASAVAHCHRLVDRRPDQEFAGPCECGRDLYRKPGRTEVTCRHCDKVYQIAELAEWMREQMKGRLVTIREGSLLLGKLGLSTPIRTLQHWGDKGWIVAHGSSAKGGNLYLFDDLIDRAAKRAA